MKFNLLINDEILINENLLRFENINKNIMSENLKTITINLISTNYLDFTRIQEIIPNTLSKISMDLFIDNKYINIIDFNSITKTDIQFNTSIFNDGTYRVSFTILN